MDMQIRAFKIISFFKSHPMVEATQEELAHVTELPPSTLKYLLKWMKGNKTLKTKVVGRWSERHTSYSLVNSPATSILKSYKIKQRSSKDLKTKDYTAMDKAAVSRPPSAWVLDAFNRTKFKQGLRNNGFYCASVALKAETHGRTTLEEALERLSGGIGLNVSADFGIEEIKKTVKSGLNSGRGFIFKPGTLAWLGFSGGVS